MAERGSFRDAALNLRNPVMTSRSTSLLPVQAPPRLERVTRLSVRVADTLDAILVIVPMDTSPAVFSALPHARSWRQLLAGPAAQKAGPGTGSVRSVNLTNSRQTRLILGTVPRNASAFETLSLAGRMTRDLGGGAPGAVAVVAPADQGRVQEKPLEALLSATLACAFEMPNFRSARKRATTLSGSWWSAVHRICVHPKRRPGQWAGQVG